MFLVGHALLTGATSTITELGRKKFREKVESELAEHCESYEWDPTSTELSGDAIHIHNVVLKRETADMVLSSIGLRVAEPGIGRVTIGTFRLLVTFQLDSTLGIFSRPWKVDIDNVSCVLELTHSMAEASEADDDEGSEYDSASSEPESATAPRLHAAQRSNSNLEEVGRSPPSPGVRRQRSSQKDWLPLHRAIENMRLTVRNVKVRVRGREPGDILEANVSELKLTTTDANWKENVDGVVEAVDGEVIHKVLSISGVDVTTEKLRREARVSLSGAPPKDVTCLVQGLTMRVHLRKKLEELAGSMEDFLNNSYGLEVTVSASRPQLEIPSVSGSLTYDAAIGKYHSILKGDLQLQLVHMLDAAELYDLHFWWSELQASMAGTRGSSPMTEVLLSERRFHAATQQRLLQSLTREDSLQREMTASMNKIAELEAKLRQHDEWAATLRTEIEGRRNEGRPTMNVTELLQRLRGIGVYESTPDVTDAGGSLANASTAWTEGPVFSLDEPYVFICFEFGSSRVWTFKTELEARKHAAAFWGNWSIFRLNHDDSITFAASGGFGFATGSMQSYASKTIKLGAPVPPH